MKETKQTEQSVMPPIADLSDGASDSRPETSPYADSGIKLQLVDGIEYTIPSPLLQKCPKLVSLSRWSQTVSLDIHGDVGHSLAHYLFTDTYQCLKPKGPSPYDRLSAEFAISVRVYVLARELESPRLEELTKMEIEKLGNRLRFPTVLDRVQIAYPNPMADDGWFKSYLKNWLNTTFQNASELSADNLSNIERKTLSVSDLLFESLIELVRDHGLLRQESTAPPDIDAPKSKKSIFAVTTEPAPEMEVEPGKNGDDPWGAFGTGPTVDPEPEQEPKPEPTVPTVDPEPEPEPQIEEEDIWGHATSKKCRKGCGKKKCKHCKGLKFEPEPELELQLEQDDDFWGTIVPKKRCKKCRKTKACEHRQDLELEPKPMQDIEGFGPPEVNTCPEPALPAEAVQTETETAPTSLEDWSLCESISKEPESGNTCGRRRQHIFVGGWRECSTCQKFILQLSQQLVE